MIDELSQSPLLYDDDHPSTADVGTSAKRPRLEVEGDEGQTLDFLLQRPVPFSEPLGMEDEAATESIFIVEENAGEEKEAAKPAENEEGKLGLAAKNLRPVFPGVGPPYYVKRSIPTRNNVPNLKPKSNLSSNPVASDSSDPVRSEPAAEDLQPSEQTAQESAADELQEEETAEHEAPVDSDPPSEITPDHAEGTPEEDVHGSDLADEDTNQEAHESGELAEELQEEEVAAATDAPIESEPSSKAASEHAEETPEEVVDDSGLADQEPSEEALESEGKPEEEENRSGSPSDAAIEAPHEGDDEEEERHESMGGKYPIKCAW